MSAYVYIFWGAGGECLYVGCTSRLGARLTRHATERPWFDQVERIEVTAHATAEDGFRVEAETIRRHQPTHNQTYTNHRTPHRLPCRRCHTGNHRECVSTNSRGEPCLCGVCRTASEQAAS